MSLRSLTPLQAASKTAMIPCQENPVESSGPADRCYGSTQICEFIQVKNVCAYQCPQCPGEVGRWSGKIIIENHCGNRCGNGRNQPGDRDPDTRNRTRAPINDISDRCKSEHTYGPGEAIGQKIKRNNGRNHSAPYIYRKHHFIRTVGTRRTETHSEKGNGLPVLDIVFDPILRNGNIDHAADYAQEQESKKIFAAECRFWRKPTKTGRIESARKPEEAGIRT